MTQPDFIQIPTQLLSDSSLQPNDRILFGYIYWITQLVLMRCVASNQYLSNLSGFSARSIQNSLTRLERQGYVRRIYTDEQHKNRVEIECLIAFKNVRTNDDRRVIKQGHEVSLNDDHNKKIVNRTFKPIGKNKKILGSPGEAYYLLEDYKDLINGEYEKWYLKCFVELGKERVTILASQAKADGSDPKKLFSHLLDKATK